VAKFRENRPRNVEKSAVGKKIQHGQNITVFRYSWSDTRATVIMTLNVDGIATYSPSRLAWSEGRRPPGAESASNEPGELSQWISHDNSALNTGVSIMAASKDL